MALNTIVILVLALVVLLFLFLAFTSTGKKFIETIKGYSGDTNVDSVIESCNILVSTNSQYSFCCEEKEVRYLENGKKISEKLKCNQIALKEFVSGKIDKISCTEVNCS